MHMHNAATASAYDLRTPTAIPTPAPTATPTASLSARLLSQAYRL